MLDADTIATVEAIEEFIEDHNITDYCELARNIRHKHKPPCGLLADEDWQEWRTALMEHQAHFEAYCNSLKAEGETD